MTTRRAHLLQFVLFVVGAAASLAFAIAVGSAVIGILGIARPLVGMALISACASTGMLMVTGAAAAEGAGLSVLGLALDRRRLGELAAGFVITATLFLAVAAVQSAMVGAAWQFTGMRGLAGALADLPLVLCLVLGRSCCSAARPCVACG